MLAGDIGGTKTLLSLERPKKEGREIVKQQRFASQEFSRFEDLLAGFLGQVPEFAIGSACFGVAGPVDKGECRTTNLPWRLSSRELSAFLNGAEVILINDLAAAAHGIACLPEDQLIDLNPQGQARADSNQAVIAAGTGLGEALIVKGKRQRVVVATEGGHTDFAPNSALQDRLLVWLRQALGGHVSYERVLSGNGLATIYRFLQQAKLLAENPEVAKAIEAAEPAPVISQWAMEKSDPLCLEALRLFCQIYGAEAGNLVLKSAAWGGVFVAGGIAPNILPILQQGGFMEGFCDKGRFRNLISRTPVKVVMNPEVVLLGARQIALDKLSAQAMTDANDFYDQGGSGC